MMVLAGDIGGSKVHLALYDLVDGRLELVHDARFVAKRFHGLDEIVRRFLGKDEASVACLGVPGPRIGGRIQMANLPWILDCRELAATLGIQQVHLLNDLEANGYGIARLSANQVYTLNAGEASRIGTRALIAAGTGLGESFLMWDGHAHIPHASEGGHVDFAPRNEDEIDLLRYLMGKYRGRVSVERVVSGMGMANIYEFLRDVRGMEEPAWLSDEIAAGSDPNAVISGAALAGKCPLCEKALDMFVSAYGAEAGNLGLTALSAGGLFIGGGIAPRILEKLKDGAFMRAFTDQGRLSRLLIDMPVHVILDSRAALMGAAGYAENRIAEGR